MRGDTEIPLIPRYFDLLVLLVERRNEAVNREEIFDKVWNDVIVSDGAMTQAIRILRKSLGDPAKDPRFIRTVSRHGYQFRFSCRFGGSDLCWRAWPMDAAAIVENTGNSGRERRLGKGCEHVQTWSGVFHNRLENASRFPRAPTGPS